MIKRGFVMAKTRILNLRTDEDLVKAALKITGDNITQTIEVAMRELIMNHKPKIEVLEDEERLLLERLEIVREEKKALLESNSVKPGVGDSDCAKQKGLTEKDWQYIDKVIRKNGLAWTLENNPHLVIEYAKRQNITQQQWRDNLKEKYKGMR
jgi:hypothetical protein